MEFISEKVERTERLALSSHRLEGEKLLYTPRTLKVVGLGTVRCDLLGPMKWRGGTALATRLSPKGASKPKVEPQEGFEPTTSSLEGEAL